MNLGENIYQFRAARNMSQGDLADALDVSRQSVSKWENNSAVPELEKLVKMAHIFGITLDELVSGESPQFGEQPTSPPPPPQVAPIPEAKSRLSTAQILGIVLLSFGALCLIVFTAVGIFTGAWLLGLAIALPFLLCGAICLLCKQNLGLKCGWAIYLVFLFVLLVLLTGGL